MTGTTSVHDEGGHSDPASRSRPARDDVLVPRDSEEVPRVSVVLPTRNEAESIERCIAQIRRALNDLGVRGEVIVADSSDDRTPAIAEAHGAIVVEPDRLGYGHACLTGFDAARGEILAMGDADSTYDFEELPKLCRPLIDGRADIVIGSRFMGDIKPKAMPPLHQYVGNPLLTTFLNLFYQTNVSDAHSGFRAFRRDVLDTIQPHADGMEFASEMIMTAIAHDLTILEVPITYHERHGEAKIDSFADGWRHMKLMLVNAPGYLFYLPGAGAMLTGVSLMVLGFFDIHVSFLRFGIHSLIAGSLLSFVGYQIAGFGFLTVLSTDPIRTPRDPITRWLRRHFTPERGILAGISLFLFGAALAGAMIVRWLRSGFTELPILSVDIVAFTAIALGIQTVFGSFFASIVSVDDAATGGVGNEAGEDRVEPARGR